MYLRAKRKIVKMYIYIYANIFVENIKKDVQRLFLYFFLTKKALQNCNPCVLVCCKNMLFIRFKW